MTMASPLNLPFQNLINLSPTPFEPCIKTGLVEVEDETPVRSIRLIFAILASVLAHLGLFHWNIIDYPVIGPVVEYERIRLSIPVINSSIAENFSSRIAGSRHGAKLSVPDPTSGDARDSKRISKSLRQRSSQPLTSTMANIRQRIPTVGIVDSMQPEPPARSEHTKESISTEWGPDSVSQRDPNQSQDNPRSRTLEHPPRNSSGMTAKKGINQPKLTSFPSGLKRPSTPLVLHSKFRRPPRPPVYPRQAISRGQEGTVTVHANISADGTVQRFKLYKSSRFPLLDQAAMAAARQWAFEPAMRNGVPVDAWVELPINFVLKPSSRSRP